MDAAGNQRTAAAVAVTVANAPPSPPPPSGDIAALYPGDAGIENHADAVLIEHWLTTNY